MTKEQVLTALNELPEEFEPCDLLSKIVEEEYAEIPEDEWVKIMAAIDEGERAIDNGDFITHEDLKEEIKTWK